MTTYSWFVRGAEHAAMLRQSVASVRRVDPDARCFVFTDDNADAWETPCGRYFIRPGLPIMMANIEAQIAALRVAIPDETLVFLDTDVLLRREIAPHHRGDLTITWRDHVGVDDEGEKVQGVAGQMPYNYGVMMFTPGYTAFEAMIWMRERVRKMTNGLKLWYGNQLAMAELAGPVPDVMVPTMTARYPLWTLSERGSEPIQIQKLPCESFNYTPKTADEDVKSRFVLHFKGKSRPLMEAYAQRLGVA